MQQHDASEDHSKVALNDIDYAKPQRTGWSRKRKTRTAVGVLAAVVIIVLAVVLPVVLTRKSKRSFSEEDLYFPKGFNGTGLNGALGGRRFNTTYDQLVAFGSSYSDNAHLRSSIYSGTIAGSGYWEGRWSNGPGDCAPGHQYYQQNTETTIIHELVWTEYLRDLVGNSTRATTGGNVTHLNYAYGGATTNNSLIRANSPDTGEQMQTYLADPSYDPRTKKPLVAMFTSTNPITGTFLRFWDPEDSAYQNETAAMEIISESAASLTTQLEGLIPSDASLMAPDFLILPILPFQITPRARVLAEPYNTTTDMFRTITEQYNKVLMEGAQSLSDRLQAGSVFTYDVVAWMYAMQAHPDRYGLLSATDGSTVIGSSNARDYLFWDFLHLETTRQERLAMTAFQIVRDAI